MSQDQNDQTLGKFLRQHVASAPAAPQDLEARILAAARAEVPGDSTRQRLRRRLFRLSLVAATTLAAASVTLWLEPPSSRTTVDDEALGEFVEATWAGTFDESSAEASYADVLD